MSSMICGLIESGHSSLDKIASKIEGETELTSRIAQAKRWLMSKYTDLDTFYMSHARLTLRGLNKTLPLRFVLDCTDVGNPCTALMISVVYKKRSIPMCWIVKKGKKGHLPTSLHLEALEILSLLVQSARSSDPDSFKQDIVILGDGEFDSPQLQDFCKNNSWFYVVRTAKDTFVTQDNGDEFHIGELSVDLNELHIFLEDVKVFKKDPYGPVNMVVWHDPDYKNPLYLLTNFETALEATKYYKKRFSIETLFGDLKSRGFNVHKSKIEDPARLVNLLIIICLAFMFTFCLVIDHLDPKILARHVRKDRIKDLSHFTIRLRIIQAGFLDEVCFSFQFSKN